MRKTEEAFRWIVAILDAKRIPFQITGGFAALVYGSKRRLADIDINVPDRALYRLRRPLVPYVVFGPRRYRDSHWDVALLTVRYKGQLIDLCGADSQKIFDRRNKRWVPMAHAFASSRMKRVFGLTVPVMTRDALIAYKTRLSRGVDRRDVEALRKGYTAGESFLIHRPMPKAVKKCVMCGMPLTRMSKCPCTSKECKYCCECMPASKKTAKKAKAPAKKRK